MEEELKNPGGLIDTRPQEEKERDYSHEFLVEAGVVEEVPVNWVEKTEWKFYDKRNQASSLSCMAQSGVKMLGIIQPKFVTLSAKAIYGSRINKDGGGMFLQDCLSLLCKPLAPFESDLPSQNMGESQINTPFTITDKMKSDCDIHKGTKYVTVNTGNIDKIAALIEKGQPVQLMMFFLGSEYWKNVPEIEDDTLKYWEDRASRHGICAVDYGLIDGIKTLRVEDSAGNSSSIGGTGQRTITEEFYNIRCYGAGYVTKEVPDNLIIPTLRYGMRGTMIKKLQTKLGGLLVDGVWGRKTDQKVREFQKTQGLVVDGIVGPKTASKLNDI